MIHYKIIIPPESSYPISLLVLETTLTYSILATCSTQQFFSINDRCVWLMQINANVSLIIQDELLVLILVS